MSFLHEWQGLLVVPKQNGYDTPLWEISFLCR